MKQLIIWCKIQDEFGNDVRGHISRTNDVIMALEEITEQHLDRAIVFSHKDFNTAVSFYGEHNVVCVIDNGDIYFNENVPYNSLIITDEPFLEVEYQPKVINTTANDLDIYKNRYDANEPQVFVYTGIESSIVSPLLRHKFHEGNSNCVSLFPGGAKNKFMQVYKKKIAPILAGTIPKTHIHIIENVTREEAIYEASVSRFVICTPSVTSIEMLTIGVPFILIQTAQDQNNYIEKYIKLGVIHSDSNKKQIEEFVLNPTRINNITNEKHTYKLAQHLHQMLMEKN